MTAATFCCPHCEKQYPNSPSLIGRKVRCSACKNVFLLQGDGTVLKVEILEQTAAAAAEKSAPGTSKHASVSRQLTQRQRKQAQKSITTRIEKGRSALRDAARDAIAAQVSDELADSTKAKSTTKRGSQVSVHLSGRDAKSGTYKNIIYGLLSFSILVILGFVLLSEPTPEQKALADYADTVPIELVGYPSRMETYRSRMWLYARYGNDLPPVIVNADKAEITALGAVNWSALIDVCQKHVGGMSLLPQFGFWVSSDKQAAVEQMWEEYPFKYDISSFYDLIKDKNIKFLHCNKLPGILAENGFSPVEIYVASLLLAGKRDKAGHPCLDYGLISSLAADGALFYEFHGQRGMELLDKSNEYSLSMTGPFCGLIVGFTDIPGEPDEWRVLDLRFGDSMAEYYKPIHNPLKLLTESARRNVMSAFSKPIEKSSEFIEEQ